MKHIIFLIGLLLSSNSFAEYTDRYFKMPIEEVYQQCNKGNYESCHFAGLRTRDAKQSLKYYLKSCYGDYGRSCYRASEKIIEINVPQPNIRKLNSIIKEVIKPVEYGCRIGNAKSCRYLGGMYAAEEFDVVNYEYAKKVLKKGCLYGDEPSCEMLEKLQKLGY